MQEIIIEAIVDTFKLVPFLFITYIIMEYIENKTTDKVKEKIQKTGKFGPIVGSFVGVFPQCRFFGICDKFICVKINFDWNVSCCLFIHIRRDGSNFYF